MILYNIIVRSYFSAIRLAALWNQKAADAVRGRKSAFAHLAQRISKNDRIIWVHCASAGELEQGKPVMEALKKNYPAHRILLTFFSPSGYAAGKNYKVADVVSYLPFDTSGNAEKFLNLSHPELVVFIKYEYWYHTLRATTFRHIPILLVSAVFRPQQIFFKKRGQFYRQMLFFFRHIFVQNEAALELLKNAGITHASVSGDTRFDRVVLLAQEEFSSPLMEAFATRQPLWVAGSTWPGDEKLLAAFRERHPDMRLMIVPHEIDEAHIKSLMAQFPGAVRYSELTRLLTERNDQQQAKNLWASVAAHEKEALLKQLQKTDVLIVDAFGLLTKLYRFATAAWVGGGFTKDGIHNILEAAVYGKPVFFGPNHEKYAEAAEMIASGGAFSVKSAEGLSAAAGSLLKSESRLQSAGLAAKNYVESKTGATARVMRYIQENRLLTK
ncbi:MAG: 3-deoxy-D-manno-octulosonic acid transferase [Flavisolibacter sp.]